MYIYTMYTVSEWVDVIRAVCVCVCVCVCDYSCVCVSESNIRMSDCVCVTVYLNIPESISSSIRGCNSIGCVICCMYRG